MQPTEDNGEVLSKIILLLLGIFIGGVVTFVYCGAVGMMNKGPQAAHVDHAGPGAAHAMENLPSSGPVAVPDDQQAVYAQATAMQPQMAQPMAQPMVQPIALPQYIQAGAPLMMPQQMQQTQVYTQAPPTVLYAGQMIDDEAHAIGRNGLRGNPCVDPPSCRGRAYSRIAQ
jgi:hypothetical protein